MNNGINHKREISTLRNKNFFERVGNDYLKNPKKYIARIIVCFLALITIVSIPFVTMNIKYSLNKKKITKQIEVLNNYKNDILEVNNYLSNNKDYFKDYDVYKESIAQETKDINNLEKETNNIHYKSKEFSDNFKLVNDTFDKEKEDLTSIKSELEEVVNITNEQISLTTNILNVENQYNKELKDLNVINTDILSNKKNDRVSNKSKDFVKSYENNYKNITSKYNDFIKITNNEKGFYNINELKQLKESNSFFNDNYNGMVNNKKNYESYYNLLLDQYYTIVTENDYKKTTESVTEPNPSYREWNEQESYTDYETKYKTETYTDRVYKGSRMVGDTKQDIYENVTKTKQVPYQVEVQKTRTVTKNNGQGTTTQTVDLAKKHAKYDSLSYSFSGNDRVGYTEWKQKYNDELVTGFNLNPYIE